LKVTVPVTPTLTRTVAVPLIGVPTLPAAAGCAARGHQADAGT